MDFSAINPWLVGHSATRWVRVLADRHYSRQTIGAAQFSPPGQKVVLYIPKEKGLLDGEPEATAAWVWHRPAPGKATRMDGYDGYYNCSLFRNESEYLSSDLIKWAIPFAVDRWGPPKYGFDTYVMPDRVKSTNPGYCYQVAGWEKDGWSKDRKKRRLFLNALPRR
jgi:hypothetical protein